MIRNCCGVRAGWAAVAVVSVLFSVIPTAMGEGASVGPNLLTNPSFEAGWSGGLADGWQAWTAAGSGYVKRSSRLGRIGPGLYYNYNSPVSAAIQMQPKTLLLMDDMLAHAATLRARLPDALIIGRRWIDPRFDTYMTNPEYYGAEFADEIAVVAAQNPDINAWQGLNEPFVNDETTARKVGRFEKAFTDRLHQHGLKSCAINVGVGNPGDMNTMLLQEIVDCLAVADYVGYHAYGGPVEQLMTGAAHVWYADRWRFYIDMYATRGYRMPPVVYTECTTYDAWKGVFTAAQIRDDLIAFEAQSKYNDPWQAGMCIFLCGATPYWNGWEMANEPVIYQGCGAYNQDHPADAWDGLYSQQFGQSGTGGYVGGVCQALSVEVGKTYRLECRMKYETYGVGADVAFRLGIDPTGQTATPDAVTIDWSADSIAAEFRVTDWWYAASFDRVVCTPQASVWFRASQSAGLPAFRISLDDLQFRALDLPLQHAPGDLDGDGDVDLADFGSFQFCFNGPNRPLVVPGCSVADLDNDTDVDLADFGVFAGCFNGPNRPATCIW